MRVYLDTSVVLRVLFNEPGRLEQWGQWEEAYSSVLWRVEALRSVDRLRLMQGIGDRDVVRLREDIDLVGRTLQQVTLTDAVLSRAGSAFGTVVGTLDAIHVASALAVHEEAPLDVLFTHDVQQASAAIGFGFPVQGV